LFLAYYKRHTKGAFMQQAISTRFDTDTIARLDELASTSDMSRSDIIKKAITSYLNRLAWYAEEVQAGKQDVLEGYVVSDDYVKARIRELGIHVD
jgi:predicted transcriptional regulator